MPVRREGAGASAGGLSWGMCQPVEGVAALSDTLFLAPRLALGTRSSTPKKADSPAVFPCLPVATRAMPSPRLCLARSAPCTST
jgi:hypothetical protein